MVQTMIARLVMALFLNTTPYMMARDGVRGSRRTVVSRCAYMAWLCMDTAYVLTWWGRCPSYVCRWVGVRPS